MTLDSSSFHPTADETKGFQTTENYVFPKGKQVTGSGDKSGSEVDLCTSSDTLDAHEPAGWCYLFVHHKKVKTFESQLAHDHQEHFIHTSIKYAPKRGHRKGIREVVKPTVSGLIFLRGCPDTLQAYLDTHFPGHYLCHDCSTERVAVIPHSQMKPFMRIGQTAPEQIRFLLRPFLYYAQHHTLLRIVSGPLAGLEGYVVRIGRDRKLVMDVGGMSVAIGGVHAERFEEVDKEAPYRCGGASSPRYLHERKVLIDRYYHPVGTAEEASAQAAELDALLHYFLDEASAERLSAKEGFSALCFMVEEIVFYYAPVADRLGEALQPVISVGQKVMAQLEQMAAGEDRDEERRMQRQARLEALKAQCGYLFVEE